MQTWLIEPRDPLIVRDGRPFSADIAGARAASLAFPFPSTTAGAVRTRYGRTKGGDFNETLIADVKRKRIHGPLLVELDDRGAVADWLLAAPADTSWVACDPGGRVASLRRLAPLALPDGAKTNLPADLTLVGTQQLIEGKPFDHPPRYWRWESFQQWLLHPADHDEVDLETWGHPGPPGETRVHVGIQPGDQGKPSPLTAIEGALYQTRGLEFIHLPPPQHSSPSKPLSAARRLALAISTDADGLVEGIAPLGGERRLVCWRENRNSKVDLLGDKPLTELKHLIVEKVVQNRACRLILLTPAHFSEGFLPTSLKAASPGVGVNVRAVAMNRPQVVSGWDLDRRHGVRKEGRPKPTRRLAPAGSVYFLEFDAVSDAALRSWIERVWLRSVSDDDSEQDRDQTRLDGFGLAILGVSERIEVKR